MPKKNKTKNKIIKLLQTKTTNLNAIAQEVKLSPSTIAQHLNDLIEQGTVICYRFSGGKKYYTVAKQ